MIESELEKYSEEISGVLKQLAHPVRLKILCCLLEQEKKVSEIVEYTGASQSWVSQFLLRMKLEGLVESRKESKSVFYRIHDPRIKELLKAIQKIYCNPAKKGKSVS